MGSKSGHSKTTDEAPHRRTDAEILATRLSRLRIELLATDCLADETAAFDVGVNGAYTGHWAETTTGAALTWITGDSVEIDLCDGDKEKVGVAIR